MWLKQYSYTDYYKKSKNILCYLCSKLRLKEEKIEIIWLCYDNGNSEQWMFIAYRSTIWRKEKKKWISK